MLEIIESSNQMNPREILNPDVSENTRRKWRIAYDNNCRAILRSNNAQNTQNCPEDNPELIDSCSMFVDPFDMENLQLVDENHYVPSPINPDYDNNIFNSNVDNSDSEIQKNQDPDFSNVDISIITPEPRSFKQKIGHALYTLANLDDKIFGLSPEEKEEQAKIDQAKQMAIEYFIENEKMDEAQALANVESIEGADLPEGVGANANMDFWGLTHIKIGDDSLDNFPTGLIARDVVHEGTHTRQFEEYGKFKNSKEFEREAYLNGNDFCTQKDLTNFKFDGKEYSYTFDIEDILQNCDLYDDLPDVYTKSKNTFLWE